MELRKPEVILVGDVCICLECMDEVLGRRPESLTYFFGWCWTCRGWALVTKTKYIPKLKGIVP